MPAATDGAGEFTRVFLKGGSGQSSEGAHKPGDHPRNTVQQRGFSSPGKSESAAAEGSVTQLFRTPSAIPAVQPAAPKSSPELNLSVTLTPPSDQPAASSESLSRPREAASLGPATNITGLLESLSTPDRPRNEPASASPQFPPGGAIESGGVTKFIQKLSEEPPIPVPAPSQAAERPEQSGPGEFTRVIARVEEKPVSPKPAEQAVVTAPPAPRVMSAAPSLPPAPSAKTPPAPKPSEPPKVPSQSKTKLETIAPVLTALNTVLLIAVLLVLILLLRSR